MAWRTRKTAVLLLVLAVLRLSTGIARAAGPEDGNAPFWIGKPDAAAFAAAMDARVDAARQAIDRMLAVTGPRTIENTLRPYDEAIMELDSAGSQAGLIEAVHPVEAVRQSAEKATQKVSGYSTELSLNRKVYDAIAALDTTKADPETQFYVKRTLRDFRLAGVDKDADTRAKIKALRDDIVVIGQEFDKNIREDVRTVSVGNVADLDGLPKDYIARHKPDAAGKITLTIDYPDSLPVFSYARSEDLRKRMYNEYNNRAYPKNIAVLDKLVAKRTELARLIGFSDWANDVTADKMVGSAKNASEFIDKVVDASREQAENEFAALLKFKQANVPGATSVNAWESTYWSERLRKADYDFDSQSIRPYFAFDRVKQGLLDVTGKLFGVTYRSVPDAPTWDPSVEAYEMLEDGKLVGRFYLDMHPRANKYNHAAEFPIRTGVAGRQLPEAALVCNLPGGDPGDPGLMTHDDVETFFHEFGHLVHTLLAGRHQWAGIGGISTEQDFVEAPSQMLEEWTRDPVTLATFARHYQTNEPIPASLVNQMRRADEFGKAMAVRRQMVYAKLSLSIYDRDPKDVDTTKMVKELTEKYQRIPYVEGTHFQTAFSHLNGYSAVYYTYMWSLVIAKDFFAQFDKSDLLGSAVATRYRDRVLAPGGSKPASQLVEDFLGRPFDFKAWQAWLNHQD